MLAFFTFHRRVFYIIILKKDILLFSFFFLLHCLFLSLFSCHFAVLFFPSSKSDPLSSFFSPKCPFILTQYPISDLWPLISDLCQLPCRVVPQTCFFYSWSLDQPDLRFSPSTWQMFDFTLNEVDQSFIKIHRKGVKYLYLQFYWARSVCLLDVSKAHSVKISVRLP